MITTLANAGYLLCCALARRAWRRLRCTRRRRIRPARCRFSSTIAAEQRDRSAAGRQATRCRACAARLGRGRWLATDGRQAGSVPALQRNGGNGARLPGHTRRYGQDAGVLGSHAAARGGSAGVRRRTGGARCAVDAGLRRTVREHRRSVERAAHGRCLGGRARSCGDAGRTAPGGTLAAYAGISSRSLLADLGAGASSDPSVNRVRWGGSSRAAMDSAITTRPPTKTRSTSTRSASRPAPTTTSARASSASRSATTATRRTSTRRLLVTGGDVEVNGISGSLFGGYFGGGWTSERHRDVRLARIRRHASASSTTLRMQRAARLRCRSRSITGSPDGSYVALGVTVGYELRPPAAGTSRLR